MKLLNTCCNLKSKKKKMLLTAITSVYMYFYKLSGITVRDMKSSNRNSLESLCQTSRLSRAPRKNTPLRCRGAQTWARSPAPRTHAGAGKSVPGGASSQQHRSTRKSAETWTLNCRQIALDLLWRGASANHFRDKFDWLFYFYFFGGGYFHIKYPINNVCNNSCNTIPTKTTTI